MKQAAQVRPGAGGTRFALYSHPPHLDPDLAPDIIEVPDRPGTIQPGPTGRRVYAIEPLGKPWSYGEASGAELAIPPWRGPVGPRAQPNAAGHFDHLRPGDPGFACAHAFAAVRHTLACWERFIGRDLPFHFEADLPRLEISLYPPLNNAQAGYGFIELGHDHDHDHQPYALNFDVIAHETGHLIIYGLMGVPEEDVPTLYAGFHESAADLTGLMAAMFLESTIKDLLSSTSGNLYRLNRLNRIAEISDTKQIRLASNRRHLREFAYGWDDEHDLSEPLTGAVFDCLVDLFHEGLVAERLISSELENLADLAENDASLDATLQDGFDSAYARDPEAFAHVLAAARDRLGALLAHAWMQLDARAMDFADVARAVLLSERELFGGRFVGLLRRNFALRGIGSVEVGPRMIAPSATSHLFSARTRTPRSQPVLERPGGRAMSYAERRRQAMRTAARP